MPSAGYPIPCYPGNASLAVTDGESIFRHAHGVGEQVLVGQFPLGKEAEMVEMGVCAYAWA